MHLTLVSKVGGGDVMQLIEEALRAIIATTRAASNVAFRSAGIF